MATLIERAGITAIRLSRSGDEDAAATVRILSAHRAELLSAIKRCKFDSLNMTIGEWKSIQETIKKCEEEQ